MKSATLETESIPAEPAIKAERPEFRAVPNERPPAHNEPGPAAADDSSGIMTAMTDVEPGTGVEPTVPPAKRSKPKGAASEEVGYRFPHGRTFLEPVPDISGTFAVRVAWQRGKTVLPLFESTPLRPTAMVTLNGQKFPVFLSQHSRKRRDRVILGGKRKTAKSPRCALRFIAIIEGREDRLSWQWRIAATSAAMADVPPPEEQAPEDEVSLYLPFAPGKAQVLTQPGVDNVVACWMNDLVVTVAAGEAAGVKEGFAAKTALTWDPKNFQLTLRGADLGGHGVSMRWETWLSPARSEAEVRAALLRHAIDLAERQQCVPEPGVFPGAYLTAVAAENEKALMAEEIVDKRGVDKLAYRAAPDQPNHHVVGEGSDTALAVGALLARYYMTGDDALRRRARLLSHGICDFQISIEESPHWGAIWDLLRNKKNYTDVQGGATLSVATTARTAKGLHIADAHFQKELLSRAALAASQWLMLKMDRDGFIPAERFTEEGPPVEGEEWAESSPWIMCEALIPLVETFRVTSNEVYMKSALRIVRALKERVTAYTLPFEKASAEHLASAIDGLLLVSREYESEEMIALAQRIMLGLRARRQPDGTLKEPPFITPTSPLSATLAGARAALALARVDEDPQWLLFALRAVRAAGKMAQEMTERGEWVNIADRTALCMHPIGVLLTVAQRAKDAEADRDLVKVKRGWQTFQPDPATNEFVTVTLADDTPADYISLVCPVSLQVLVAVLAPAGTTDVKVTKNAKTPFLKNLLNGDFDAKANLVPLGDGVEAMIGVFIADT